MAQITLRPLAKQDLMSIWSYLAEISEETADALLAQFDQKFHLLAQTPFMGRSRPELSIEGLRSFPFQSYVIFYLPGHEHIEIVRVLHERRDIQAIIGEP